MMLRVLGEDGTTQLGPTATNDPAYLVVNGGDNAKITPP